MAKTVAVKKSFNFTAGLNTEAGPLTYPPNTWAEGDNMIPAIDGSLSRRLAVNYESGYSLSSAANTPTEESNGAFVCEEWNSVGGNGSRNFLVVQRNHLVSFYDNVGSTISTTLKSFSIDLTSYQAAGNPNAVGVSPISCTVGNGKLVITSADTNPILVTYNTATNTISHAAISIKIRDLYGVSDGLAVNDRPTTLSNEHKYNLLNQGWDTTKIDAYFAFTLTKYPSNAQSWTAGKDTSDDFSPALLDKQDFGTSPAPKGRYTLPLFSRDRTAASSVASLATETELYRPTTCAFYAGRAWYAGVQSDNIKGWVLFSQVADTDDKFGKCYQDADPTSEVISDLVDTDGGVIPIQDAGSIVLLKPSNNSMLVFCDNGIWQIVGGSDSGFSATSYEVRKISSVGCTSARSVVEAEQAIYFWSADGIWAMGPNDVGAFQLSNITNTTIQTLFTESIPIAGRAYASGRYYQEDKTIYWAFNSDTAQDGVVRRFKKSRLLCLDLRLKSFFTHTISSLASNSPYLVDVAITKNKTTLTTSFDVVDSSEATVVVGADTVTVSLTPSVPRNSEVRFLAMSPVGASTSFKATFAWFEDGLTQASKWKDWYAHNSAGATFDSFVVPGYDLGNDQAGDKAVQALYVLVFLRRTETGVDSAGDPINPSSCSLQARWDWTDNTVAKKWSVAQEVYRHRRTFLPAVPSATFNDGYPVVVSKSKVRGRGKALQLKFQSHVTKDMQILGWATTYLGNSNV